MNHEQTTSILQRAPVILAVTAAAYGLSAHQPAKPRHAESDGSRCGSSGDDLSSNAPVAQH